MTEIFKGSGKEVDKRTQEIIQAILEKYQPSLQYFAGPDENDPTERDVAIVLEAIIKDTVRMAREERGENNE